MDIILANGLRRKAGVHKIKVHLNIESHSIKTVFCSLPSVKDDRILFQSNFSSKAGFVLDVRPKISISLEIPIRKFNFAEEYYIFKLEPQRN